MPQTLFVHARLATVSGDSGYALIDDAALLVGDDKIEWL